MRAQKFTCRNEGGLCLLSWFLFGLFFSTVEAEAFSGFLQSADHVHIWPIFARVGLVHPGESKDASLTGYDYMLGSAIVDAVSLSQRLHRKG